MLDASGQIPAFRLFFAKLHKQIDRKHPLKAPNQDLAQRVLQVQHKIKNGTLNKQKDMPCAPFSTAPSQELKNS